MSERRVTPERFKAALMALHNAKTRVVGMGLEAANPAELVYLVQEYLEDALHDLQLVDVENKRLREALEYYADPDNWKGVGMGIAKVEAEDQGEKARAALREPAP